MLEPALFLLALLLGALMGAATGSMVAAVYFNLDKDGIFMVTGAVGGAVVAIGVTWSFLLPAIDLAVEDLNAPNGTIATVHR